MRDESCRWAGATLVCGGGLGARACVVVHFPFLALAAAAVAAAAVAVVLVLVVVGAAAAVVAAVVVAAPVVGLRAGLAWRLVLKRSFASLPVAASPGCLIALA